MSSKPIAVRAAKELASEHSRPMIIFSHNNGEYDLCQARHFTEVFEHHGVVRELMVMPNGTVVQ